MSYKGEIVLTGRCRDVSEVCVCIYGVENSYIPFTYHIKTLYCTCIILFWVLHTFVTELRVRGISTFIYNSTW